MNLIATISKAYDIFKYPKPNAIHNVCNQPCCMPTEEANKLLQFPLNEIPVSLLHEYNDNAQALAFDINEFKYFLPRYLELLSLYEFTSALDESLSLKNLNFQNESFWQNEEEKECIIDFSKAFFQNYLQSTLCYSNQNILDILNLFYTAGISIEPLLHLWEKNLNTIAIMSVEHLVMNQVNNRQTKVIGAFFTPAFSEKIMEWLRNNKNMILKAIEYHIFETTLQENDLQRLSYMYDFFRVDY